MELKDKLNLLWKFLFLAIFTYGVISFTCYQNCSKSGCKKSGSYQCEKDKKQCKADCNKPCCKKKVSE